jgi:hypothetical protein
MLPGCAKVVIACNFETMDNEAMVSTWTASGLVPLHQVSGTLYTVSAGKTLEAQRKKILLSYKNNNTV